MTTEQEPFNFFLNRGNVATGQQYPDMSHVNSPYQVTEEVDFQTAHTSVPTWNEPTYNESASMPKPAPEPLHREPQTPSWSYAENPLFATLPADMRAHKEHESTPLYENLITQSSSDRLVQRVQEQTVETPDVHRSVYHQIQAEQSIGSVGLMTQALHALETAPEPQLQPEQVVNTADLPVSNAAFYAPVPLWSAPRRVSDGNIGLESNFMRGPLPDTVTPRLKVKVAHTSPQETSVPTAVETVAHPLETVTEQLPEATETLPDASSALLARLAEQAAAISEYSDGETTQVMSTADLAKTVAEEKEMSAGEALTTRVTVEATASVLETKHPKTILSYGRTLLEAAGFKFRMRRDETTQSYYGEIVDSEGTVQVDQIKLDKNAEGERMRTTRRVLGRMARLGMRIPKLPDPRIA